MAIHLITKKATKKQIEQALETLSSYIKVAVDTQSGILAAGGALHADCEAVLIDYGSRQENIWGANWIPSDDKVTFEALLNIAPRRKNPSMEIQSPSVRAEVEKIVRNLLGNPS